MSQDHTIALQPRGQSETTSQIIIAIIIIINDYIAGLKNKKKAGEAGSFIASILQMRKQV